MRHLLVLRIDDSTSGIDVLAVKVANPKLCHPPLQASQHTDTVHSCLLTSNGSEGVAILLHYDAARSKLM